MQALTVKSEAIVFIRRTIQN